MKEGRAVQGCASSNRQVCVGLDGTMQRCWQQLSCISLSAGFVTLGSALHQEPVLFLILCQV